MGALEVAHFYPKDPLQNRHVEELIMFTGNPTMRCRSGNYPPNDQLQGFDQSPSVCLVLSNSSEVTVKEDFSLTASRNPSRHYGLCIDPSDSRPHTKGVPNTSRSNTLTVTSPAFFNDGQPLSRHNSSGSCTTLVADHDQLISSLKTTEKFTNKWPRPKSLKILNANGIGGLSWRNRKGIGTVEEAVSELEEGYGLGFDSIDKWTWFKWCLVVSVTSALCYGSSAMVCAILTWFKSESWNNADVMYVTDSDILILLSLSASILMFAALVGLVGTLLNSRPILAVYTLLLWPSLISMLAVGYTSYKRYAFSLDLKLNFAWSQYYTPLGRLMIQNSLRCCGYYDPLHEAIISSRCYPRTPLPGCKGILYRFERENLSLIWSVTFSILPLHLINIAVALLCANHVTHVFGKGITPKRYRLTEQDVKADKEKIWEEMKKMDVERVRRPGHSRASSNTTFREDREERKWLLETDSF
ncbi:hypothetical protein D9757_010091 [Collybiopsis confluens]|uniref:Tetraspanin Tsp2 n=1 Tax=Collybiopsis confluens TaxID=2823264 RepID=A0A8H5GLN5_9AGAR|nr:hypothetical protein D9757_010091 [Collybiopsis confluens]